VLKSGEQKMVIDIELEPTTNFEKYMTEGKPARVMITYKNSKNELQISIHDSLQKLLTQNNSATTVVRQFHVASSSWNYNKKRQLDIPHFLSAENIWFKLKFQYCKSLLIDLIQNEKSIGEIQDSDCYLEVLESMLDMKFSIMTDSKSCPIITVSNKQYTIEIDFLGRREKTAIMKYLVPHLQFLSSDIILYDQMELHLDRNKKFLAYLAHLATKGKQIFVTCPFDEWKIIYSLKGVCEIENRKEGSVVHMND